VTRAPTPAETREAIALLLLAAIALVVSGIAPRERGTWLLEVLPVLIAAPILAFTWKPFRLTPLAYRLIFLHALVLMLGGHYTYAHVPLGFWLQEVFDFARNPYDRIGHFMQGFEPAILIREILLRRSPLRPGKWTFFLVCCVALAFSAVYEFVEWWVALLLGQGAMEFLGTQGDPWDTQWDMFMCLIGAATALVLFSRIHDRQLARLRA
jgi:putative membrane protein